MQAALPAFPALRACEYEQGFDFSLSTLPNLNTLLLSLAYKVQTNKPTWHAFKFSTRNMHFSGFKFPLYPREFCQSYLLLSIIVYLQSVSRQDCAIDIRVRPIFSLRPFCLVGKDQQLELNIYFSFQHNKFRRSGPHK